MPSACCRACSCQKSLAPQGAASDRLRAERPEDRCEKCGFFGFTDLRLALCTLPVRVRSNRPRILGHTWHRRRRATRHCARQLAEKAKKSSRTSWKNPAHGAAARRTAYFSAVSLTLARASLSQAASGNSLQSGHVATLRRGPTLLCGCEFSRSGRGKTLVERPGAAGCCNLPGLFNLHFPLLGAHCCGRIARVPNL